ncbi:MAG: alpha-N-acetylglucosaminidase [Rudaea sp.]|uniref:alpha-N-acetylglucosaminidase n=1 Tax=unclassified Rudaea TaxID=2627037 RepID=UPI0010F91C5C|nr:MULTISPECIES: alpha-N-acetylglucosaminidase [unclassified Rudaea]MBN8886672.1 alpha-N-acetylglucosaminidase [Rudaea sp.]
MRLLAALLLLGLGICARAATPAEAPAFDLRPAQAVVQRVLGARAKQIELAALPAQDGERFRIARSGARVRIEGSTASALLFGLNWYLKYVAHRQVSTNGDRLGDAPLPLPDDTIEHSARLPWRYALNQNTDGYTMPYWDWPRWEREIDLYALSGINAMIVERGMDSVLYETFRDFGYSDRELRSWITQPAHQNWQLMGNLCCFDGPISRELMGKRARSAQQILARLRELGITPVLPGFYGIVPADFAKKFPQAHVIEQGDWAGFTRPGWLDPRDPLFAKIAASFYRHQRELFGENNPPAVADRKDQKAGAAPALADIYDMEIFQEGGSSGNVPVREGAHLVQAALDAAHPGAKWMMLAWQGNPQAELLAGVDRSRLFIIDIDHDKVPRDDRETDFKGAPFLFGGIWAFGGRTTFGADLQNYAKRLPRMADANPNMIGTAVFAEGMDTNPFAFDLFTEMAWRDGEVDGAQWTAGYVQRRYGAADAHALAAWKILRETAYAIAPDTVEFNSEREAGQESLFAAQPSLTAFQASHWSPVAMRYDAGKFAGALPELLRVAPELRTSDTYRYDLVDVARQTLANESRALLPRIKATFEAKDRGQFTALTQHWLALMDLQDRLLATQRDFLVGVWLDRVRAWASTPEELRRLDYDARSILTTWGERKASEGADLHDYGNKDWAGLTRDYYMKRWKVYFAALDEELRSGITAKPIDWFALGEEWNRGQQRYTTRPQGDSYALAAETAKALGLSD